MLSNESEVVLKGGRANVGNVVRIGDQVARPTYAQTETVDHFLRFMVNAGVPFVPEPFGFDAQGRHRLRFIPGVAPTPPYPPWAFDEHLLVQVAHKQRRLHEIARGYQPLTNAIWAVSAGDYFPSAALDAAELIVCHNDLGMTNVIVGDDRSVAGFIDFDYCRPVDRLFDIAVAIRHWAPFGDLDLTDAAGLDRVRRFALFCDVHELDQQQRRRVADLAVAFLDQARENIKTLAATGQVGFQKLLAQGYEATNLATVGWLIEHTDQLAASG